ncbi:unnamed protein product [Schistosoma margrebowiei]|uniref:Uncharacterized protein n=1 Tax=Schistosoma margrebowiei TaxID=48269 RepID=A0A183MY15_9TREM|nr:unnamed protein product [Schistosoma margrebowiei]
MERLDSLLCRLEKVTILLEAAIVNKISIIIPLSQESGNPSSIKEFHEIVTGPLSEYVRNSFEIGDIVGNHASMVKQCFLMQEGIIKLAAECSKPSDSELKLIITPLGNLIEEVITVAPSTYVKTMQEASEFFTNRVLMEYKNNDTIHRAWKKSLMSVWTALQVYVNKHHTTGLVWNARGKPAVASKLSKSSPTREVNSNCSAPSPPVLTASHLAAMSLQANDSATQSNLFADLNRGTAVTSNLRKVTDDMKTHKNPKLREGPIIHTSRNQVNSSSNDPTVRPPSEKEPSGAGCLELRGNRWIVENFQSAGNLQIVSTETKQTVCIHKCNECTVQIKGKINSIMMDNCKKTGVVFDHLISSIDVVNCQSVKIQCLGQLSTVNIDKTDGCQVFLSEDSKYADVITAKSSEINILIPKGTDDFEEFAVPEQFKTNFTGKGLKTVCSDSR